MGLIVVIGYGMSNVYIYISGAGFPIINSCSGVLMSSWNVFTVYIPSGRHASKLALPYGISIENKETKEKIK